MRKIGFILTLFVLFVSIASAQSDVTTKKLPVDSTYRIGKLDNGMTYFIRKNAKPESLASFYIARSVGSIQEDDNQDGLAHFLEHMAFNGTKHFPDKALLNYLQSIGAEFGRNINAYTSQEATVYMITNIPIKRQGVIDSSLLAIYDWSHYISLLPEEVDKERGVIREELRTSMGVGRRLYNKMAPYIYNGTKYKDRLVIGTDEGLKNFKQDDIVSFYNEWYRPEYEAVIVVGDFDLDKVEKQVVDLFSDIPAPTNVRKKECIVIPDYTENVFGVITDPEQTSTSIRYTVPLGKLIVENEDTYARGRENVIEDLVSRIIGERFSDLTREANPPFQAAYVYQSPVVSTTNGLSGGIYVKDGGAAVGITSFIAQIEKLRKYGVTKDEFDRAIIQYKTSIEADMKRREDRKNSEFVDGALNRFLANTALMSPEQRMQFANETIATLTLDELNKYIPKIFTDKNCALLAIAPEKGAIIPTTEELKAAFNAGKNANLPAPENKTINKSLISKPIKDGKITKQHIDAMGNTVWNLSNGAKVVLKPTDYKQDQIMISGSKFGGSSICDLADIYSNIIASSVVGESGLGDYSASDLEKVLTGKRASVYETSSNYRTTINGNSSAKSDDIKTMFQLLNLKFTAPRFEQDAFDNTLQNIKSQLQNYYSNPSNVFSDSIQMICLGKHDRKPTPKDIYDNIDKITLDGVKRVYTKKFDGVDGMTFNIIGKFNIDSIKPLVTKYIASLPKGVRREIIDMKYDQLKGNKTVEFKQEMEVPKTSVYIKYSGNEIDYNLKNIVTLQFLSDILNIRYTEIIREEKGATYGVGVGNNLKSEPKNEFSLMAMFDTNDKVAS
ncbi:MAG: insulinase family protein, partial [Rikenellaceae bacterium]